MTKGEKARKYAESISENYIFYEEAYSIMDYLAGYNQAIEDTMVDKFELSEDWTKPDTNETVDVPDHLMPLLNKIGTQLRFHAISGKSEVLTAVHILRQSEVFFLEKKIITQKADN